jgi:ketosteroid isomerase-like protein
MKMMTRDQLQREPCLAFPVLLSQGDLNGALRCLTRDACVLTPDGTAVHGRQAIAPVVAQLIASRLEVRVEFSKLLLAGDAAVAYQQWAVSRDGAGGARITQELRPTLFLHRIEGDWRLAIVLIWGLGFSLTR